MTRLILTALCVAAAAGHVTATPLHSADIAGRWQGDTYSLGRSCDGGRCKIALDITRCGDGWCGVEVTEEKTCGGRALALDAGKESEASVQFNGTLELAAGTEPYVVQAWLVADADGAPPKLDIIGDTGGEFRLFRRSFPFTATLARTGEAVCTSEKPVS
jgi:hypothetical protein